MSKLTGTLWSVESVKQLRDLHGSGCELKSPLCTITLSSEVRLSLHEEKTLQNIRMRTINK